MLTLARMLSLVLTVLLLVPVASAADGLPVAVDSSAVREGIVDPERDLRYHATQVGGRTLVYAVELPSGRLAGQAVVRGGFAIPAVAIDGTPSGLAADGSRLVVIRPRQRFPRRRTQLAIFEIRSARELRPDPIRPRITLPGDFSFDAISPDGDTIYLVEYLDRRDPTEYRVRALDIASAKLDPEPVLDPEEPPGDMRGYPMTRVTSPDGEWEYTLYDGGGDEPFIHALDVARGRTVCIDVPQLESNDAYRANLAMSPDGQTIIVTTEETRREPAATVALVDTSTHEASAPPPLDDAASGLGGAAADGTSDEGGGPPVWAFAAVGLAGALLVAGAWLMLRERRIGALPVDPFTPGTENGQADRAGRDPASDGRDRAPVP